MVYVRYGMVYVRHIKHRKTNQIEAYNKTKVLSAALGHNIKPNELQKMSQVSIHHLSSLSHLSISLSPTCNYSTTYLRLWWKDRQVTKWLSAQGLGSIFIPDLQIRTTIIKNLYPTSIGMNWWTSKCLLPKDRMQQQMAYILQQIGDQLKKICYQKTKCHNQRQDKILTQKQLKDGMLKRCN